MSNFFPSTGFYNLTLVATKYILQQSKKDHLATLVVIQNIYIGDID